MILQSSCTTLVIYKMRLFIVSFLFLFIIKNSSSQNVDFEGILSINSQYESFNPELSSQQLKKYFGDSSLVFIKGSYYKYKYLNSAIIDQSIFDPKSNRCYFQYHNIDTLFYINCDKVKDIYSITKKEESEKIILGYQCKKITIKSNNNTTTYYYTPELKLENSDFINHKLNGYNLYWIKTKSIYLMTESVIYNEYKVKNITVKINKMKLDEEIFKIPDLPVKEISPCCR